MDSTRGVRWGAPSALLLALTLVVTLLPAGASRASADIDVIVRAADGEVADARRAVVAAGGSVLFDLPVIGGFAATAPQSALGALDARASIVSVTPDRPLDTQSEESATDSASATGLASDPATTAPDPTDAASGGSATEGNGAEADGTSTSPAADGPSAVSSPNAATATPAPTSATDEQEPAPVTDQADPTVVDGDVPDAVQSGDGNDAAPGADEAGDDQNVGDGGEAADAQVDAPATDDGDDGDDATDDGAAADADDDDDDGRPSSLYTIVKKQIRAHQLWKAGHTGAGVDVALIDSGVARVKGLDGPGKVQTAPDFSRTGAEGDAVGHGTHLAGIIAGRDPEVPNPVEKPDKNLFTGVAPDADIVSVKVAGPDGQTTMSRLIAGIGWVLENATSGGRNIRVLNLSFNAEFKGSPATDPLAIAVDTAWRRGLVVVTAAGNEGPSEPLDSPAWARRVLAVGASDPMGTTDADDDDVASWSSCGDATRHVDVVAPGTSVLSLRAPGSQADRENPASVVDGRLMRGSGTSQAAAVVSGAVALLLDQNPGLTPDQVKSRLTSTSRPVKGAPKNCQGGGMIDVEAAGKLPAPAPVADATGSAGEPATTPDPADTAAPADADAAAAEQVGQDAPVEDPQEAETSATSDEVAEAAVAPAAAVAELDARRRAQLDRLERAIRRVTARYLGVRWSGSRWSAVRWLGSRWSGSRWSAVEWLGSRWSGSRWSGSRWSGSRWSGSRWSGSRWSGSRWSGSRWSGSRWSGSRWSTQDWGDDG